MIIEVKKLNALKKYSGDFVFSYPAPQDKVLLPLTRIEGDVKVEGTYEIYDDDSVAVRFTVGYLLAGSCSYCLSDASKKIEYSDEVLYVPEKDPDNYEYDGIKIDLKSAVDDAILFSQPDVLLCREDCQGIDVNEKR